MHATRYDDWFQRAALERTLPFAVYISFLIITDILVRIGWEPSALRWLYGARIALAMALLWQFRHSYRELSWPHHLRARDWLLAVLAGLGVFVAWIHLDAGWMMLGTPAGFNPGGADGIDWLLVAMRLTGAVLVVPLMEELFWRSFLMRWIDRGNFMTLAPVQVSLRAFLVTMLFFGFEHAAWLAGLLAGAVYALLYMRSGSLWLALVAHAVTNALLGVWVLYTHNWHYW